MGRTLEDIQTALHNMLREHVPPLQIRKENEDVFEAAGTIPAMQGKQKVDGYYFASVVPKPKDIRFYFFPIYTHADSFGGISPELRKCLKGKSCFHIPKMDDAMATEIGQMIETAVSIYQKDGLI